MPSVPRPIKVAIVEDHQKIREGLMALIDGTEGFRAAGSFRSMEEALAGIGQDLPDVALLDIGLPGMSGIEGVRVLKERYPHLLFLMLTVYDDDARIFDAICAGACGYLLKNTPPARLLESLQDVMAGGAPMSPEVARRVIELFREIRPPRTRRLSPHSSRSPPPAIAGGWPQLQDRGRGSGDGRPRRVVSHAEHLREAAGPLQGRGCGQGLAPPPGSLNRLKRSYSRR